MDRRQFLATLSALPTLRKAIAAQPPARHVVLVSIDGMAACQLLDDQLEIPNIRELIRTGVWAESSETVFPSVTHPSHTSMSTGVRPLRHGVVGNNLVNRETGEEFHITNKRRRESVRVPTIFDAAKQHGRTTASFFWPETLEDPSIDFNLPEVFNAEGRADIDAVPPSLLDELRQAGVPIDHYFDWYKTPRKNAGDMILTEAAAHIIRTHRPGLLAIHLVSTDSTQHNHGPSHYLAKAAFTNADHCVGILRKAAHDAGIEDQTTFIIASDHGFHSVYEEVNIRPAFSQSGLQSKVRLHGGGWSVYVELLNTFDTARDMPALQEVFRQLKSKKAVARVITPDAMHGLGLPRYEESPYIPGQYLLIPDIDTHLTIEANSESIERRKKSRPYHGHGYLPSHPRMYPALALSGAGIRRGVTIPHTNNLNLAPTIAHLLGFRMTGVEGTVLSAALAQ